MTLRRRVRSIQTFVRQRDEVLRFRSIPDARDARGQRWSLPALLGGATLTLMLLAKSLRRAEELSEDLAESQQARGIKRRIPDSTLGDALAIVPDEALHRHLHQHILQEHRRKALEPEVLPMRFAAIDGKTLATHSEKTHPCCQAQHEEGEPERWLFRVLNVALISAAAPVCIAQMPIPAETNEMGAFPALFELLRKTYGRAGLFEGITTDAGVLSQAHARRVDDAGIAYVLNVKGNQPTLQQELQRLLLPLARKESPEAESDWECDSSRGWIKYQLWRTEEIAGWLDWESVRQGWLVRVLQRQDRDAPVEVLEDRLYVTNLARNARLGPTHILRLVRAHWRIENNLHGSLDIQWEEDHGRWVRRGNGLPVVGLLRAIAYNLLCLLQAVHFRSAVARRTSWAHLRDWVFLALVLPELGEADLSDPVATA